MNMQLHYIFDPLCGWCYGAAGLVHVLAERLAPAVPLRLWPGALFAEPVEIEAGMRAHIVGADRRIHELTGAEFGAAYVARIGNPANPVTLRSVPVIAALAAVPMESRLYFLEALQRAHYVEGRDLSDLATLNQIAAGAGFDGAAFARTMQDPAHGRAAATWISEARALMGRVGAGGFPAFALERDGALQVLDHQAAYRDPQALVSAIESLAR